MSTPTAATLAWRWFTGHTLSGRYITNATWTLPSRGDKPVLHPTGHAVRWHHMPRLHRAAIRTGTTILAAAVLYGLAVAFWLTVSLLAAATLAAAGHGTWQLYRRIPQWRHRRRWVRPLRRALAPVLGSPPPRLQIESDRSAVIVGVPVEFTGSDREREAIIRAVTTKLALDAPAVSWAHLRDRRPYVAFTQSDPPPPAVDWDDVAAAVGRAGPKQLIFGIGRQNVIATASYGDSPHLAIPGGSGGGKSNLAAFLLLQELMRGSLIFNLDPKWISHLWLQDLPNVINALEIEDLHDALCWLGRELKRRTRAAYYSAGGTGRVRGRPGDRIIVLAEELNYGMPDLKDLWTERRAQEKGLPKKSPAISALSALACAGRASDMHMWLIAQLLTVESTGVRDSTIRTNAGIKAMARWDKPGWDMAAGKHIPMPEPTVIPGRIQLVTGGEPPRETQVPYLHLDDNDEAVAEEAVRWARQMAVSGRVAQIPTGPEGVPPQLWPASVRPTPRLALPPGQSAGTCPTVIPPADLTIIEAVQDGIFGELNLGAARRRVNRAGIEPAGRRGDGQYTYARADLSAAARDKRRKDTAA